MVQVPLLRSLVHRSDLLEARRCDGSIGRATSSIPCSSFRLDSGRLFFNRTRVPLLRSLVHRSDKLFERDPDELFWCHFFDPLFIVPTVAVGAKGGYISRATSSIPCSSFRLDSLDNSNKKSECHFFDPLFIVPTDRCPRHANAFESATSSIPCSSFRPWSPSNTCRTPCACHFFDPLFIVPTQPYALTSICFPRCHFFDPLFIVPTYIESRFLYLFGNVPLLRSLVHRSDLSLPTDTTTCSACHFFDPLFIVPTRN